MLQASRDAGVVTWDEHFISVLNIISVFTEDVVTGMPSLTWTGFPQGNYVARIAENKNPEESEEAFI